MALREVAAGIASSPQLRNMGTVGGNLLQSTRCHYWRLRYPCHLHGGDRCHAREGEHRESAVFANGFCASAHPSDVAAALVALGARVRTTKRELPLEGLYRVPEASDIRTTTLEPGEVLLDLDVPTPDASVYLKAILDQQALRALPARRRRAAARAAARRGSRFSGVALDPWLLELAPWRAATPLPGNAYKVGGHASALLIRALATIGSAMRRAVFFSGRAPDGQCARGLRWGAVQRHHDLDRHGSLGSGRMAGWSSPSRCARPTRKEAKPTTKLDPSKSYTDHADEDELRQLQLRDRPEAIPERVGLVRVTLVQRGFFDKTVFHRIVTGFVIQGGDPTGTGSGGPGYSTVDTPAASAQYTLGTVAMAKTGTQPAGTAGSQFFIVTTANAGLTPDYAIIGKVIKGIAVVKRIGKLGTADEAGTPTQVVEIQQASVKIS